MHQSITEATQFMVTPDRIKELSGWRGDVTNGAGKTPSMNNDDYKADLDAINIKIMMEKLKVSQSEATQQYYNDLRNGKYTRASMFNDNVGLKYVKDSILKSFGVSTMDELKIKSIVSFNFIESLESNSNDLIGG
ncbi:hypothetical protein [Pseudolactococcus reticulitermitis]|uniref:Uncharacterized protein n=1 Tax=Pseudolactococcus reticulitermitis TaxID=2025039 RepID=A0A224XAP1_9LACT|nr:hypothetical protein [Lactococcus reticulitermitis]GAX48330.1 hypothetical protein RsY01_1946 [Lactococcus reticulitermitis]